MDNSTNQPSLISEIQYGSESQDGGVATEETSSVVAPDTLVIALEEWLRHQRQEQLQV